jgi:valyl-tRNA synthetase
MILIILGNEYTLWSSSLCSFLQRPLTSSLSSPNILLSSLFYIIDAAYLFKVAGNETAMDLWMLSRISAAVDQCNEGFQNYDFQMATTACHKLWLHDLCDVYLECLKPVFQSKDTEAVQTAKTVLYTTLHVGLRLLSPFMPFITEELFQRLPHIPGENAPSICIAQYPDLNEV